MNPVPIPQYIDNLPQVGFWEADEIAPAMIWIIVGYATHTLLWMLVPMYVTHKLFMRFKEHHMRGYALHLAYRIGLLPLNKRLQNGAITRYHV